MWSFDVYTSNLASQFEPQEKRGLLARKTSSDWSTSRWCFIKCLLIISSLSKEMLGKSPINFFTIYQVPSLKMFQVNMLDKSLPLMEESVLNKRWIRLIIDTFCLDYNRATFTISFLEWKWAGTRKEGSSKNKLVLTRTAIYFFFPFLFTTLRSQHFLFFSVWNLFFFFFFFFWVGFVSVGFFLHLFS